MTEAAAYRWRKALPAGAKLTRGELVCAFIEFYCYAPEGEGAGKRMRLDPFQVEFILAVYDNPEGTNLAILSIGKKNGKTGLIAGIVLAHVAGPEARLNSQIVCGAMSRKQASIVFNYAAKMVRFSPQLIPRVKIVDSRKQMYGLAKNVEFQAIAAVAKATHGISPIIAIIDEAGQVRGPRSDFIDAITTAQGAYDDGILFIISHQAASDADYLSIEIDRTKSGDDPHAVCHVYEAAEECDVMDKAQWKAANPALGTFRSLKDMQKLAKKALDAPAFTPTFRNLNLNQRVETNAPFVSRDIWNLGGRDLVPYDGQPVWAGLDLSAVNDLTAFVWLYQAGGQWNAGAIFWTPEIGIRDRSRRDKEPYDVWVQQGLIQATPGASIDPDYVATQVLEASAGWNLQAIAFDTWRIENFKAALNRQEAAPEFVEKMHPFRQGTTTMGPALDALERELLNGRVAHGANPVMKMCARNAKVTGDDKNGNRKLDKMKSIGRIDGMVALAMAAGAAAEAMAPAKAPEFQMFFLGGDAEQRKTV